jgi:hypothetical protein
MSGEFVEPVPASVLRAAKGGGIRIRNLCKTFRTGSGKARHDVKAVKSLSVDLFESQIFCLLGHNGAVRVFCFLDVACMICVFVVCVLSLCKGILSSHTPQHNTCALHRANPPPLIC